MDCSPSRIPTHFLFSFSFSVRMSSELVLEGAPKREAVTFVTETKQREGPSDDRPGLDAACPGGEEPKDALPGAPDTRVTWAKAPSPGPVPRPPRRERVGRGYERRPAAPARQSVSPARASDWPFRSCSLGQPNCRRFSERVQRQQASATPTAADRGPLRAPPAQGNPDPCGCYRRVTFQGHDDGNFLYYTHEVLSE